MVIGRIISIYKNSSIKRKLLLVLYILITIPLIIVGTMSYNISSKAIETKAVEYSHDMLSIIRYRLIGLLNSLEYISQDLMYNQNIYQVVIKKSFSSDRIYIYEQHQMVVGDLKQLLLARDELKSACIVSFNGLSFYADNNKDKMSIMEQIDVIDMLAKARQMHGRPQWYLNNKEGIENVFLIRTISNREDYSETGFMVLGIKKSYLSDAFTNLESDYIKNLAVIDEENQMVFASSDESEKIISTIGYPKETDGYEFDYKNNVLKAYISLDNPKWRIVTYIPLSNLYEEVYNLRSKIIWVCVFVFIAISLLGWLAAKDIINPIMDLVKKMKHLQSGETTARVIVDRQDELGYLGQAYNKMVDDMSYLMNSIYREQITRKDAELKALQSQMNPHFLFNTLESINWMAQIRNIPEISDTVSNLSSLIEAGIGRDSKLITLQEEFSYIDQYVAIIKRRLEDRLNLIEEIEDSVLQVQIPRLLIQPIVENAVYHGIEQVRRKGEIALKATSSEGRLVITIYDNGAGIPSEELTKLRDRLAMNDDEYFKMIGKKGKSVGIENVNRRIKLFYGQEYGLQIESEEGQFTMITVTIPLEIRKEMEGFYVQSDDNR